MGGGGFTSQPHTPVTKMHKLPHTHTHTHTPPPARQWLDKWAMSQETLSWDLRWGKTHGINRFSYDVAQITKILWFYHCCIHCCSHDEKCKCLFLAEEESKKSPIKFSLSSDRESRGDTNDGDDDLTDPKSEDVDGGGDNTDDENGDNDYDDDDKISEEEEEDLENEGLCNIWAAARQIQQNDLCG